MSATAEQQLGSARTEKGLIVQHPILLSALLATTAVLLLIALPTIPVLRDLRRQVELAVELTILAALAVTGATAVIQVAADHMAAVRAITGTAVVRVTDTEAMAVGAHVEMARATETGTTRTPAMAAGTRTVRVLAPATTDRTTGTAADRTVEAAVVKP